VDYINSSGIALVIQMLIEARIPARRFMPLAFRPLTKVFTMVGITKYAICRHPDRGAAARKAIADWRSLTRLRCFPNPENGWRRVAGNPPEQALGSVSSHSEVCEDSSRNGVQEPQHL